MSPALKRALLIAALLLAGGAIGFGLYFFFRATGAPTAPRPTLRPGATGTLPVAGERPAEVPGAGAGVGVGPGALPTAAPVVTEPGPTFFTPSPVTKLTSELVSSPSVNAGGALRFHNPADGKFYRTAADGSLQPMSDQVFYNVQKVTWAKNADKAIMEYPDGNKIVYNFATQKQTTLLKHWSDFSFSTDGNEVVAKSLGLAPENRWLITFKDDGTGSQLIEPLGGNADKVTVSWSPSRQTVAFSQTGNPQGVDRREVLLLGLNGENFKSLIVEGQHFEPNWSPTGQKLLYSVDSYRTDFKPELWVADSYGDAIGDNRQAISINTWAHKCAFGDDTTLFCAVPRELPIGAGMSPAVAADSRDDLYRIDLQTGYKTPVPLDRDYTIENLSYDKTNNRLFFTDRLQTGAFQVNL